MQYDRCFRPVLLVFSSPLKGRKIKMGAIRSLIGDVHHPLSNSPVKGARMD